ncbi:MAG: hypothetical protein AM1032_000383 [Mycoplasmataceae bacterium]|nr:MAG: hypothetical protein AM1032_000383 [Mycoplasmataceae bacterium]
MNKSIYTLKDKVSSTILKVNKSKTSKDFGKEFIVIECENNNIIVKQNNSISNDDWDIILDGTKILNKNCVFRCFKLKNDFILKEIVKIED